MTTKTQEKTELEKAGAPEKTAKLIVNKAERGDAPIPGAAPIEDKRATARQEHSHFTNRADFKGQ